MQAHLRKQQNYFYREIFPIYSIYMVKQSTIMIVNKSMPYRDSECITIIAQPYKITKPSSSGPLEPLICWNATAHRTFGL